MGAIKIGGEQLVNIGVTVGDQYQPSLTATADGGYVVAYCDVGSSFIRLIKFDSDGNRDFAFAPPPIPFSGSAYDPGNEIAPWVEALPDGGFRLAWTARSTATAAKDVFTQRYTADGIPMSPPILIADPVTGASRARIELLDGSRYLLTWADEDTQSSPSTNGLDVRGRIIDPIANTASPIFTVNTDLVGNQFNARTLALPDGGFVAVYSSTNSSIKLQQFDSFGQKVGAELLVASVPAGLSISPQVELLEDGFTILLTWASGTGAVVATTDMDIRGRLFDTANQQFGPEFPLHAAATGSETLPAIANVTPNSVAYVNGLRGSDYHSVSVVVWTDTEGDGNGSGIMGQLIDENGQPIGSEFVINSEAVGIQEQPRVAFLGGNRFVVAWTTSDTAQDGSGGAIKSQIFQVETLPVITSDGGGDTVTIALPERIVAGQPVTTVTATLPFTFSEIGYDVYSDDGFDLFYVDEESGEIRINFSPDFENPMDANGDNIYELVVSVYDKVSFERDTQIVSIVVTDVVETPTITSNGGGAIATVALTENGTGVTQVTAISPMGEIPLLYELTGIDAAYFYLDAVSGSLSFREAPDFESPNDANGDNIYEVVVRAIDPAAGGAQGVGEQSLSVIVNDLALDSSITGTSAPETLTGTVSGENIFGLDGNDKIYGRAGADRIQGGAGKDRIFGEDGSDEIDGGTDNDTMFGGFGEDRYFVDSGTDKVIETGEDFDRVFATASFTLPDLVEELTLLGTASISGIGNDGDNQITGNEGGNYLSGLAGGDVIDGMAGDDVIYGGDGQDVLYGGKGDDILDLGAGEAESALGGLGNDVYRVYEESDAIFENADEGIDEVWILANYQLPDNVENALVRGGFLDVYGNELANVIRGSTSADSLFGLDGNDTLLGESGHDTIEGGEGNDLIRGMIGEDLVYGGGGADRFEFREGEVRVRGGGIDRIGDFSRAEGDRIWLNRIDAIAGGADDSFTFIGDAAFTGTAGQLRYARLGGASATTRIYGDTNGDRVADFQIELDGDKILLAADFVL